MDGGDELIIIYVCGYRHASSHGCKVIFALALLLLSHFSQSSRARAPSFSGS
jgi:hypothetical protein